MAIEDYGLPFMRDADFDLRAKSILGKRDNYISASTMAEKKEFIKVYKEINEYKPGQDPNYMLYKNIYEAEYLNLDAGYPVGQSIKNWIKISQAMARALKHVFPDNQYPIRLWCQGSSGAMLAALVATHEELSIHEIIHVKKHGEHSHSSSTYVGSQDYIRNIIIDDFISSGETVKRIYTEFKSSNQHLKIDAILMAGIIHTHLRNLSEIETDWLIAHKISV